MQRLYRLAPRSLSVVEGQSVCVAKQKWSLNAFYQSDTRFAKAQEQKAHLLMIRESFFRLALPKSPLPHKTLKHLSHSRNRLPQLPNEY